MGYGRVLAMMLAIYACVPAIGHVEEPCSKLRLGKPKAIPVFVTPYYDSDGPKIDIGPFSKELAAATSDSIGKVVKKMKEEWSSLSPEAMCVTAIRLYDTGHKDDATYWFYSARYRAMLLYRITPRESIGMVGDAGFERESALQAFFQLSGEYIKGYAFGDLPALKETLDHVLTDNEKMPEYKKIYPDQKFIAQEEWNEQGKEVAKNIAKLRDKIDDPEFAAQVKADRAQRGIDGKY